MRNFLIILEISRTHLLAKKKQTIVAALGVTFGISMFIVMMSFMTGLNQLLDGLVLNRTPHIQIYNKMEPTEVQPVEKFFISDIGINIIQSIKPKSKLERIHNGLPILKELRGHKKVKGATPQVTCKVFYLAGSNNLNGVISGLDVEEEIKLFNFNNYIVEGEAISLIEKKNSILIGIGIAKKLSLSVGDKIQVANTAGTSFLLTIGGIYQSGLTDVDEVQSYVSLQMAQQLIGANNDFLSRIHVKLYNIEDAIPLSILLQKLYDVEAVDIKTANAQFDTGSDMRTLISYAVSITLLIVAGFGIYNILNMFIYEKINDIAILKAMGFLGSDVLQIFITQALFIGLLGGFLGMAIGYVLSVIIDNIPYTTEALPTVTSYPVNYNPMFYLTASVFALIFALLAGYLPARKAKKIDPVDIIRGQ